MEQNEQTRSVLRLGKRLVETRLLKKARKTHQLALSRKNLSVKNGFKIG
jgi:hypothetical protein